MRIIIHNGYYYYMNVVHSSWVYFVHDATPSIWVCFETPFSHTEPPPWAATPHLSSQYDTGYPQGYPYNSSSPSALSTHNDSRYLLHTCGVINHIYRGIHMHPEGSCTTIILYRYVTNVVAMIELFTTKVYSMKYSYTSMSVFFHARFNRFHIYQ